jgi:K+-transporting ATPase KdpF subunit
MDIEVYIHGGYPNGSSLRARDWNFRCPYLGFSQALRKADGRWMMNVLYIVAGVIGLGLFVYLVLALLKPEWFG